MPNPRPAAEWAKNLVVDQIHGQYACECQYISKMCHHHEFQVTAISNALDAYARQQVETCYQVLVNEASCDHAGLSPADPVAFRATLDQIVYSKVEAFRERVLVEIRRHDSDMCDEETEDCTAQDCLSTVTTAIRSLEPR